MKLWIKEFREFALRGNMVDLAIGVIIGAAFGKVVTSLVNDIIMPPIGFLLGGVDFSMLSIKLHWPGSASDPVEIKYGLFINAIINLFVVAGSIFFTIKGFNRFCNTSLETLSTKKCSHCYMSIPYQAKKCAHCASSLSG